VRAFDFDRLALCQFAGWRLWVESLNCGEIMRKTLIIKTGKTFPWVIAQRGDFEDWVLAGMSLEREQVSVIDVSNGANLPNYEQVSGIVITGSHAMVTEHLDWSEYTAQWLRGAVERQIPTLGICYGHQLLAHSLAGKVDDNPKGREYGTVAVQLLNDAQRDLLFGILTDSIAVHVSHKQSVLQLPSDARLLASSAMDPHQAFVIGDRVWGIQFHPEFDTGIVAEYINHDRQLLAEEGRDPDEILENVTDTPYGRQILQRFCSLIKMFNGTV